MHPYLAVPDKLPARVTYYGQHQGGYPRAWCYPAQLAYRDEQQSLDVMFYRDWYPRSSVRSH